MYVSQSIIIVPQTTLDIFFMLGVSTHSHGTFTEVALFSLCETLRLISLYASLQIDYAANL